MVEIPKRGGGGGADIWEKLPKNPVFFYDRLPYSAWNNCVTRNRVAQNIAYSHYIIKTPTQQSKCFMTHFIAFLYFPQHAC